MPRHPTNVWTNPHQYVTELISLVHDGPDPLGIHFTRREAFSQLASALAGAPTKAKAEIIRYFWRNMPKRKYPTSFNNGGIAKRSKYAYKKYGGGDKKFADKYKHGGKSNIEAILYEAESRAKKAALKVQETLVSEGGWRMNTNKVTLTTTGSDLSGLNQSASYASNDTATRGNVTNRCFVYPLSPLSQLGNSGVPGYRAGQKINVSSIYVSIQHYQGLASVSATYHYAIIRNCSTTFSGTGYDAPGLTNTDNITLFRPKNQGPLSAQGPSGQLPDGNFSSLMPWNTSDWRVYKRGHYTTPPTFDLENASVANNPSSALGSTTNTWSKNIKITCPMKNMIWDYTQPSATNGIKGGDFYFVMWREGYTDNIIGRDEINGIVRLMYKDP